MKEVVAELLKKINEKNVIWFALTFLIVVLAILVLPKFFQNLSLVLEGVGISTPYSKILIFVLYLSVGFLIMKPVSSILGTRKKNSKFRELTKKIDKLPNEEFQALLEFAVQQRTHICFRAEYTHIARLLKAKGLLSTGWHGPDDFDGSEDFFMSDKLLDYLTEKFKDEIHKVRTQKKRNS